VAAWPTLPDPIKAAIQALIDSAVGSQRVGAGNAKS
jgi:hypothetical protein